ncbi:CsbD family protein [Marinivivus vitaminiproducens]|uniref:CsbD family protein n=1 Tax=Marinivivus vitaminiproducens TaxID=3035935 RepID=UPI00279C2C38|nr:CsbD family protein [Geminicoccaceae bacterium SCSIO 64248]
MDKDRTSGTATNIKGKIKEAAGKLTGNERLEAEGKAEQVGGKAQNTYGQAKDTVRDTVKK